jgi:sterol desaturase/sphingolipid hydroxylase (fatty acid hydroxylase superfamily)
MKVAAIEIARMAAWLVLLAVIFVPLEKLWALRPQRFFRKAFTADLGYYFLNGLFSRYVLIAVLSLIARSVHRIEPGAIYQWSAALPAWFRLAAALLVGEVGSYWGHRAMHEIPVLWRFHEVHHNAEEMDWLVNTHAHPVDLIFTRLCGLVPMYLLGLAQPLGTNVDLVPLVAALTGTVWGFFVHANIRWRFGWLEFLVSTPVFHHWHHTKDGAAYLNRNYAATMPWIDKCFGTFFLPDRWPASYGVDHPAPAGRVSAAVVPSGST